MAVVITRETDGVKQTSVAEFIGQLQGLNGLLHGFNGRLRVMNELLRDIMEI